MFSQQNTAKGDAKSLFASQAPKSVAEYMKEHQSQQELELSKQEEAEQQIAAHQELDEVDEMLDDLAQGTEDDVILAKSNRRRPGMSSSNLTSASAKTASKPKAKAKAGAAPESVATATPSMTSSAVTATAALKDDEDSSKAASKTALDTEMAMVASKHMGSERGSSVKALQGLVPATFLVIAEKRYAQSAKLRGVSFSVSAHQFTRLPLHSQLRTHDIQDLRSKLNLSTLLQELST